jgi:photosystem II stability/assembly factor-like uncharacterized protein
MMRPASLLAVATASALGSAGRDAATVFRSGGMGGGGSMFSPSMHPTNASELWVTTDMGTLFHSSDGGARWGGIDSNSAQGVRGGRWVSLQFTSTPGTLFVKSDELEGHVPKTSTDNGASWAAVHADPTGGTATSLWSDPTQPETLLLTDPKKLYHTNKGGRSWTDAFTNLVHPEEGFFVGGVHWLGQAPGSGPAKSALVGTNQGVLLVEHGGDGRSGAVELGADGIPAEEAMFSFAGGSGDGRSRLYCLTAPRNLSQFAQWQWDEQGFGLAQSLYTSEVDWSGIDPAAAKLQWRAVDDMPGTLAGRGGNLGASRVTMWNTDPGTLWLTGVNQTNGFPSILQYKAGSWSETFHAMNNENIATGWMGYGGMLNFNWGYGGGAYGVNLADGGNRILFTDAGSLFQSGDDGQSWAALEVLPADRSAVGQRVTQDQAYKPAGLEPTSLWYVAWADAENLFLCYTDIVGARSVDGGASWSYNFTGHTLNTMYMALAVPAAAADNSSSILYAATSSVHDMYINSLTDAVIDRTTATGQLLVSTTKGASWDVVMDFGRPVVWVAASPTVAGRLYACVVNASTGGVYACDGTDNASCTRLPEPPRTHGHPWTAHALDDGSLLVTYSAHQFDDTFTNTSGLFLLPAADVTAALSGGGELSANSTWLDLSHPAMMQYTKDVVIDPSDSTQSTWLVAVSDAWGKGAIPEASSGLYRTEDRGKTWVQFALTLKRGGAQSATVDPCVTLDPWLRTSTSAQTRVI